MSCCSSGAGTSVTALHNAMNFTARSDRSIRLSLYVLFDSHVRPQRGQVEFRLLEEMKAAMGAQLHTVATASAREAMTAVCLFGHGDAERSLWFKQNGQVSSIPLSAVYPLW
jgi:hypothetical protein